MAKQDEPVDLFYSYAHADESLRDQLEKHLSQLRRQGMISEWHDRKILPGGAWADEIDTHLKTSSIILLLVSPDFLDSNYCYDNEMQLAFERHSQGLVRIIPIILRPCDWQHSPLKDFQCLPRDGKPVTQWSDLDEVFNAITQELREVVEQQKDPALPLSPRNRQNRMRMLKQMRKIWIDGLLARSLDDATRIKLCLQEQPDMVENPLRQQVQETDKFPKILSDETTIVQVYDKAEGELLILGKSGAGKTILLLELTRTLLGRAENDEQLPMPIVFNLSSWTEKHQSLRTWLVEELERIYRVPHKTGQSWIDTDQILPLLDGLDEVAKDGRTACIQQINAYYESRLESKNRSLVVCCRTEEYAAPSKNHNHQKRHKGPKSSKRQKGSETSQDVQLKLQQAVSIQPLTDNQINTYLEKIGEEVEALRQVLNEEDAELRELARQPLMLNILMLAYQGATLAEVPTGKAYKEMQQAIFARYVQRMITRREKMQRWTEIQFIRWLIYIAKHLHQQQQTAFFVEELQPDWLPNSQQRLYQRSLMLVIGLVVGLAFWLGGGLISGLFGALAGGWFGVRNSGRIQPAEIIKWKGILEVSGARLLGTLVSGLALGLISWLPFGPVGLLIFGLVGMFAGLLIFGSSITQLTKRDHLSPNEGTLRSGRNGLLAGLIASLSFGLVGGLLGILGFGQQGVVLGGLGFGLGGILVDGQVGALVGVLFNALRYGLVLGWGFGLEGFVKHFFLRFRLWRAHCLPWDLIPFLDEAAKRLLLHKLGNSYIFIHRLLFEHFAMLDESDLAEYLSPKNNA